MQSYELKFLVSEAMAEQIELWARQFLAFDPHADAALGNAYRIHSLYLDTAELDVYRRTPSYGRRKFRLRRYGTERGVFLERKTKAGERVRKRRTLIPDTELIRLQDATVEPSWPACWFQRRVQRRRLQPTCLITYDRVAHVGASGDTPMRLTLDRHIHCAASSDWATSWATSWRVAEPPGASLLLLPGQVVLELKYRTVLPALFKRLVQEFNLRPRPASKYRLCVEAWSLDKAGREAG